MSEQSHSPRVAIGLLALIAGANGAGLLIHAANNQEKANKQPACVKQAEPGDSLAGYQTKLLEAGDKNVGSMTTSNGAELVQHKPQVGEFMIAGHVSESTCREVGGVVIDSVTAQSGNVIEAVRTSVQHP